MRALHSAERKGDLAPNGEKKLGRCGRRVISLLLCFCMTIPMLFSLGEFSPLSEEPTKPVNATKHVQNRVADPDTMDSYVGKLLSEDWGSRYAGRVWTDKSVFAYTADKENIITLDMKTDGYDGKVGYNADFGHVFSALASSQKLAGVPPVRTVIVFDNSASMYESSKVTASDGDELWSKQRIGITIEAINRAIDLLMEASVYNEVAVVLFGDGAQISRADNATTSTHVYHGNSTAVTILPMKHYTPNIPEGEEYTPYLTGGWSNSSKAEEECFNGANPCHEGTGTEGKSGPISGGWVFVNNEICGLKASKNEVGKNWNDCGDYNYTGYINGTTNIQAGYYVGMQELLKADKTVKVGSETYQCVPSLVMLTDGAATDKMSGDFIHPSMTEDGLHPTAMDFVNDTGNKLRSFTGYKVDTTNHNSKEIQNFWDMFVEIVKVDGVEKYESIVKGNAFSQTQPKNPTGLGLDAMKDFADYYSDSVASMLLGTLMTTAYYKAAVRKAYGIADGKTWSIYSLSVDMVDIHKVPSNAAQLAKEATTNTEPKEELPKSWQYDITSNAPTMDPSEFFYKNGTIDLDWLQDRGYIDKKDEAGQDIKMSDLIATPSKVLKHTAYPDYSVGEMIIQGIVKAGHYLNQWEAEDSETFTTKYRGWNVANTIFNAPNTTWPLSWNEANKANPYTHSNGYLANEKKTVSWPQIDPDNAEDVTKQDVLANIGYNTSADYASTAGGAAEELAGAFQKIIDAIVGPLFISVDGQNAAGVSNSVTYQDPLGEYMEIKNEAITTTPHHVDDPTVGTTGPQIYDMALLVFGEMHGLVRAGVYDWNWNDKWMEKWYPSQKGEMAFPQGWYKGTAEEAADAPLGQEHLKIDESGSWPAKDPVSGKVYTSAEDARDDGWVMRFNFTTLLQFVPITGVTDSGIHPDDLPDQVKNTVYTCYRFAGSQADRNKLHRNPIFGSVPDDLQAKWQQAYKDLGNQYPVGDDLYAETSGVYRLSDIRVWTEDTGDFVDTEGAIAPNGGYDRSLYLDVPAAVVPTQLATVTLGEDGVLSYLTNLATDKGIDYEVIKNKPETERTDEEKKRMQQYEALSAQSTPLRLFYAVGVEEELILRDAAGNQNGVDFTKVSPEYIAAHSVVNQATGEQQNYVWFISNYYSNTTYGDYVADMTTAPRTRGDPTVTFSPSEDNRYYVFQKPLPLYAHAYRVQAGGTLKPVDNTAGTEWKANKAGNGSTTWENSTEGVLGGGSWTGGEFIGTYKDEEAFKTAYSNMMNAATGGDQKHITDDDGNTHLYQSNGIVFLEDDLMDRVTSNASGYTSDSISFSSDDYYFILLEYYLPTEGIGTNLQGDEVAGSTKARKVQHVLARKGSEFGSGFVSNEIDNGDMLCWTDMNGHVTDAFKYLSKSETGDPTRGEPTFEKLTLTGDTLKTHLLKLLKDHGVNTDLDIPNPDYDPTKGESDGNLKEIKALDYLVKYWTEIRENEQVKAALEAAKGGDATLTEDEFNAYFQFAVATRPGGIRTGDMSSNIQTKGETYDPATQLYKDNNTKTSNTYYLPTISENSGTDNNVIINNYLGNNGYLEIANQMLHVTKTLEAPEGFALTDAAEREKFNYQLYVQGVSGKRSAILTEYNEYAKVWERKLAYIDVLTDNSDLVLDNSSNRAVFISAKISTGLAGEVQTAKMVVTNGETWPDGSLVYYEANEDGTLPMKGDGTTVDESKKVAQGTSLYYLYLPPIKTTSETTQHVRRLFQNKDYDGTADGYVGPYESNSKAYDDMFKPNGVTTFVDETHKDMVTPAEEGADNRDSYRLETGTRPAGCRTYWAQDAELIPISEVQAAEATNEIVSDGGTTYEIQASAAPGMWTHADHTTEHSNGSHIKLTYYNLVIRRPEGETSATAFSSPLSTRSAYMTVDLVFGTNANVNDGSERPTGPMTADDVYDQIIPSVDRPDLFGSVTLDDIAANTAEFTLRHGEGLLLSSLDNRIAYRFTEKLTTEQMEKGYTLKEISHIQQVGSKSTYLPGVQEIPIYTMVGATYGDNYPEVIKNAETANGLTWKQDGLTPTNEPFAHTNAVMWECYATMAAGASGNHHQPAGVTGENAAVFNQDTQLYQKDGKTPLTDEVENNPSCQDAKSKENIEVGKCDVVQDDGTTLHYMYYNGQLVDPHYNGEASSMLRNMARYVVSPTVHFGVDGETQRGTNVLPATNPDNGYYEYNGVYSVYGNTGWFEEQAHYINTVSPEMLVLTKQIVDKAGKPVENPPEKEFTFTLTLFTSDKAALYDSDGRLYYWKGLISNLGKSPEDGGPPCLDKFQEYIPTDPAETGKTYLTPLEVTTKGTGDVFGEYTVTFKANEAVVIYGLSAETNYAVEETPNEKFPVVGGEDRTEPGTYMQFGTVVHDLSEAKSMFPNATPNRKDFYNQLPDGELTIGKKILDSDAETVTQNFTFEVTLTPLGNSEGLTATKYDKNGEKVDGFTLKWDDTTDGKGQVATFELQHGETVVIGGIPLGTKYTVKETKRDGYNLQHVADNKEDKPVDGEKYLDLKNGGIEGTVTADTPQVFLLFANGKAVAPPFTGGLGAGEIVLGGVLLIGLSVALFLYGRHRKRRVI